MVALCWAGLAPPKQNHRAINAMTSTLSWPHAPVHWTFEPGIYMVTAGLYRQTPLLHTADRRDLVLAECFNCAQEFGWHLQAWAVMTNHYHFVAHTEKPESLSRFMSKLHGNTARVLNREDRTPGRRVWFEFWDSHITYEASWLARLKYVHTNPIHHGVVQSAEEYPWCSAGWFRKQANQSLIATIERVKIDSVNVRDDFEPCTVDAAASRG